MDYFKRISEKQDVLVSCQEFIDNEFEAGMDREYVEQNLKSLLLQITNQYDRLDAGARVAKYLKQKYKGE